MGLHNLNYFHPVNSRISSIHPIYVELGSLAPAIEHLKAAGKVYTSVFFTVDESVSGSFLNGYLGAYAESSPRLILPGGESQKNTEGLERIWAFLIENHADRSSLLVNIGGGALCDVAGFAASTYMRGIDFIQVPTTLLAMVDASVGGKTAINAGGIKNPVGTFCMPAAVCIEPAFLETLPLPERKSGLAEMIKHGLIASSTHYESVIPFIENSQIPPTGLIRDSIAIKSAIVERDPTEKGERKLLNFGHTVGHGIESYLSTQPGLAVLHGEAVAAGMLAELYISVCEEGFVNAEAEQIYPVLLELAKNVRVSEEMIPGIIQCIKHDKKNLAQAIGISLLKATGKGVWSIYTDEIQLAGALRFMIQKQKEYV